MLADNICGSLSEWQHISQRCTHRSSFKTLELVHTMSALSESEVHFFKLCKRIVYLHQLFLRNFSHPRDSFEPYASHHHHHPHLVSLLTFLLISPSFGITARTTLPFPLSTCSNHAGAMPPKARPPGRGSRPGSGKAGPSAAQGADSALANECDIPEVLRALPTETGRHLAWGLPPMHKLEDIFQDMAAKALELGFDIVLRHLRGRALRVATMCSGTESPLLGLEMIQRGKNHHT